MDYSIDYPTINMPPPSATVVVVVVVVFVFVVVVVVVAVVVDVVGAAVVVDVGLILPNIQLTTRSYRTPLQQKSRYLHILAL